MESVVSLLNIFIASGLFFKAAFNLRSMLAVVAFSVLFVASIAPLEVSIDRVKFFMAGMSI